MVAGQKSPYPTRARDVVAREEKRKGRTERNVRGPDDARQHGLPCRQRPFPVCAARLFVIAILRFDITVEVFVLVDRASDASGFLSLGWELERDLKPR